MNYFYFGSFHVDLGLGADLLLAFMALLMLNGGYEVFYGLEVEALSSLVLPLLVALDGFGEKLDGSRPRVARRHMLEIDEWMGEEVLEADAIGRVALQQTTKQIATRIRQHDVCRNGDWRVVHYLLLQLIQRVGDEWRVAKNDLYVLARLVDRTQTSAEHNVLTTYRVE